MLLAIFISSIIHNTQAQAQDATELPLIVDTDNLGLITVHPHDDETKVRIEVVDLFRSLAPRSTQQFQMSLWKAARDGMISIEDLRKLGLEVRLDLATLEVHVQLPNSVRRPQDLSLQNRGASHVGTIPPARTSFILNAYTSRSIRHERATARDFSNANHADFDSALNIGGVVLEAEAGYNEFDHHPWHRGGLRLVYDAPDHMLRSTAGDLLFPADGYRTFIPMGGVSFSRDFNLNPDAITQPSTRTQVLLKHPARVDVLVNGALVRTLRLGAGRFDIRDIPVGSRVNNIELVITDIFGRVETVTFPFIAASELLAPGLHYFSYNAGLPSRNEGGRYEYNENLFTLSVSHRLGLNDQLTTGGFYQGNRLQNVGGLEAITASTLGLFRLEAAASRVDFHGAGFAARLGYRSFPDATENRGFIGWGFQLENRDRRFAQLGTLAPDNRFTRSADVFMNSRLARSLTATMGASQEWGRPGIKDARSAYLNFAATLTPYAQMQLDLSASDDSFLNRERRVFVTLRLRDADRPLLTALSYDSRDSTKRFEAAYEGQRVRLDANASDGRSASSANMNLTTFTQRSQIGYALNSTDSKLAAGDSQTVSLLQFGTALVMADGAFALSRPVPDSFAIIGDRGYAWQNGVRVNPNESYGYGEVNIFGPAVLSDLISYRPRHLQIDTSPLSTGYTLRRESFSLRPRYRSGYHLSLELEAVIIARGLMLRPDGSAAALQSGYLAKLDGSTGSTVADTAATTAPAQTDTTPQTDGTMPSESPETPANGENAPEFFTDRSGRFEISGLNEGDYELRFHSGKWKPISIHVPKGQNGFIEMGELMLQKKE